MSDNTITPLLWRALSDEDEKRFREHTHNTYNVGEHIDFLWHPVIIHECYLMNKEAGILKTE
jgi:hypothetical protein